MAVVERHDADVDTRGEGRGWSSYLGWPVLALAGWLLYECTAQPGLAAAVACAKFGWADLRAAFWLRRVDPDRRRAATCFWCYLTFGLWKVAVMSTLIMILLGFLGALINPNPRPLAANKGPSPVLGGALAAAGVGFGLSVPAAYVATGFALRHGVRIWLGAAPHRARRGRFWPPCHGKINFGPYVGFTTVVLTVWLLVLAVLGLALAWRPGGHVGPAILVIALLGSIGTLLSTFSALCQRLFARSPAECWPAQPDEIVYQSAEAAGHLD
jgi:hypothetical protein